MARPVTDQPHRRHPEMADPAALVLPHDEAAERALIGGALIGYPAALAALAAVDPGDFYRPAHGHIAAAVNNLAARGDAVDSITVAAELDRVGLRNAAGGDALLIELAAGAGVAAHATGHAELIVGHARARRVMHVAREILDRGYSHVPAAELLDLAFRRLDDLPTSNGSTLAWADIAGIIAAGVEATEETLLLRRNDGRALLYAGRIHFLQGEPGSGKGWLALLAAVEVMAMGGAVVYIDLEDTDAGIVGRLLSMGAQPADIVALFTLVRPTGPLTATELGDLEARAVAANPELIILDGLAEALANDGLDENSNIDVTLWLRRVPRRLTAATKAALVVIDHVTKSAEERGRYARGAGAKLAALDGAAYSVIVRKAWSRVGPAEGLVDLVIAKDRHGAVGPTGATAAHVHVTVGAAGGLMELDVRAPSPDEARGLPTEAMTKASAVIDANPGQSTTQLMAHRKPFGAPAFQRAIDALCDGGYVRRERKGNGSIYHPVRRYPDGDPGDAPPGDLFHDTEPPIEGL